MKKLILFILGLLPGICMAEQIPVKDIDVTRQGNNISVSFQMNVPEHYVGRNYKRTLVPVLFNQSGEIGLAPIAVIGKTKLKRERQEAALSGKNTSAGDNVYILKNGSSLSYNAVVPYQSWMGDVAFGFDTKYEGCCESIDNGRTVLARNIRLEKDFIPFYSSFTAQESPVDKLNEPFILPMDDYGKKVSHALKFYFPQNVSTLDPDYMSNRKAFERLGKAFTAFENDKTAWLKKIVITGFASPEGTLARNDALAEERATSLQRYIDGKYRLTPGLFEKSNGGIDWIGLTEMLGATNYMWKNEAMEIIENVPEPQRIMRLKKIGNGTPYRIMLNDIFPALRTAAYITFYYQKNNEQGKKDEIYNLVKKREYQKAIATLLSLSPDGWTYNMLGICYQMTGEKEKARNSFSKAVSLGNSDAGRNLEQLNTP